MGKQNLTVVFLVFIGPICLTSRKMGNYNDNESINGDGIAMKTNDYVKFLTETIISRLDTPKDVRKKEKMMKKQQEEPFFIKMFGNMPHALLTGVKMAKNKRRRQRGTDGG